MTDSIVDKAKEVLSMHFIDARGRPVKTPYYQHQLQVLYERQFFEWVVAKALRELVKEGRLVMLDKDNVAELGRLKIVHGIRFYANADAMVGPDAEQSMKRRVMASARHVEKYSDAKHTRVAGRHLESLVKAQLKASQFEIVGEHTSEYAGRKWIETDHNLDFIAHKKGKKLTIGVEVKNTLGIIPREEIDIKIDICDRLGIVPVFAVRWIKPHLNCIRKQGGFSWMFRVQMFPLGYEKFVSDFSKRFSVRGKSSDDKAGRGNSNFPVTVRTELPEKPVAIFEQWVAKVEDNPPSVDTSHRCTQL